MMLSLELTKCLQFQSIHSSLVQRFWMILVPKVATLVLAHCCFQFQCTLHCLQFQCTLLFADSMHITLFAVSVHITLGKTDKKNRKTQKRQTWKLSNLLRVRFPNFSILLEKMRKSRHFWPKFENGGGSGRFRMDQNENVMEG